MENFSALVVRQWLAEWDRINFDAAEYQSRPPENFLLMSIPARLLRQLSNTYRRGTGPSDTGIQRKHDESRSEEIARFVRDGYPISSLSAAKKATVSDDLRKPGWLPTAIVINILDPSTPRAGRKVRPEDALQVSPPDSWERGAVVNVSLPDSWSGQDWKPTQAYPIEVIDGQHRLWSFIEGDEDLEYDLPVVAFFGIDISWQAYLFWTINIKPKKINASLAYDLYPLLRDQEWLRQGEGLDVYRETRAQELTEVLWSLPTSPWHQRINMLGESGVRASKPVTQAAFVRSVSESLVRPWKSRSSAIGGLFGGSADRQDLDWTRAQQGAFLSEAWRRLATAVGNYDGPWASSLREAPRDSFSLDPAFAGPMTLLAADQGIRAFHQVLNDVCYVAADALRLRDWKRSTSLDDTSSDALASEVESLSAQPFVDSLNSLVEKLARFDWRNSRYPELSERDKLFKQSLRGTGGYKLLRDALLKEVADADDQIGAWAQQVAGIRA